jgi:hypothetical protein
VRILQAVAVAVALLAAPVVASAQISDEVARGLRALVSEHGHPVAEEDGELTGPGLEVLHEALDGTLFLALGELHGSREVPRIAGHLFHELQARHGYEYLAVENGPFIMEDLHAPGVRGDLERMARLAVRYPMSLHMGSLEELGLIEGVMRSSRARSRPVWGVGQVTGALHLLDPMIEHTPDEGLAGRLLELREEVAETEERRFELPPDSAGEAAYLGRFGDESLFRELREAYAPLPGSAEARWFDGLIRTSRFHRGQRGGEPGPYRSHHEREEWIRDRFLEHYGEAQARGDREPRVIVKLGETHLARGFGPTWVSTLGNLLAELAYARGAHSVHLLAVPILPPDSPFPALPERLAPLLEGAEADGWTLVDLRPLRRSGEMASLREMDRNVHDAILGWDFLLVIRDATLQDPADLLRVAGMEDPEDPPEPPDPPDGAPPTNGADADG